MTDNQVFQRVAAAMGPGSGTEAAVARIGPLLGSLSQSDVSEQELSRICAIARVSRAIPTTLNSHPELAIGPLLAHQSITLQVRQALLQIAGDELLGALDLAAATKAYSTTMDQIVTRVLRSSRVAVSEKHPVASDIDFAVIAMGKWGAEELNYASDIDLIFVHDAYVPDPESGRKAALALASRLVADLSSTTFDGPGLVVDADLRPEGTMGPLSRGIGAYANYYEKWAEPWELQALLKARPAAGSPGLGERFMDLAVNVIWDEGLDVEALRGLRKLKMVSESNAPARDIKRGPGGIRDVEFTVQMLQLVHGRHDPSLRRKSTLEALQALANGGYLTSGERDELAEAYVFLRRLEHRIQLWDLRQTHRFPEKGDDRRRLAVAMGLVDADALVAKLREVRTRARSLHERIYFRPILESMVGSSSARLGPKRAAERLTALGFGDPVGAGTALESLTKGLSRRSRAMQQMLPLMLDWFSLTPEPDLGLSQLRLLLANTPDHSQLVTMLLNDPIAGERLCLMLGTARLVGDLIDRIPEFIPRLREEELIDSIRPKPEAIDRLMGLLDSRPEYDERIGTIRRFARRRRLRIAARDIITSPEVFATIEALSDTADAAVTGAVRVATNENPAGFSVIAMGRWGGGELSYGSDLDLMYVYDGLDREGALTVPTGLRQILSEAGRHGEGYELDAGLRPEGKNGPIARSVDSYVRYYQEWAEPWELMALTRARPVAGDAALGTIFLAQIEPILWRKSLPAEVTHAIRLVKARVETERIGPDEDPDFHLKLGPGSLSDIEFLTQLLQLQQGGRDPSLRSPNTMATLAALRDAGHISATDFEALSVSYEFCTRVRLRLHLQRGRLVNSLPTDPDHLASLAASLGFDRTFELRERYRQVTRRARRVFVRHFFD